MEIIYIRTKRRSDGIPCNDPGNVDDTPSGHGRISPDSGRTAVSAHGGGFFHGFPYGPVPQKIVAEVPDPGAGSGQQRAFEEELKAF